MAQTFFHGSRGRLLASVGLGAGLVGATAAVPMTGEWSWTLRLLCGWTGGTALYLGMAWRVMISADAAQTMSHCRDEDQSRGMIDMILLFACAASMVAVCLALRESGTPGGAAKIVTVGIPVLSMVGAWFLVHTVYALHYARMFYHNDEDADGPPQGGFDFHQEPEDQPDYRDFIYLALSIGCTFGVTDTNLTSKPARRAVVWHTVLSFALATLVLALSVDVVSNLISPGP